VLAAVGLAGLVRVDALREVALVVLAATVPALRRHPAGVPLAASALLGAAVSAVPAIALSRPYLDTVAGSLRPLIAATVAVTALFAVVVTVARWRARNGAHDRHQSAHDRRGEGWAARLAPGGGAGAWVAVVALGAFLASRPAWAVAHQPHGAEGNDLVASLQAQQHLPVDATRTYAERSVEWIVWYAGSPASIAALLAVAAAAGRAVRRLLGSREPLPGWFVPLTVAFGSVVLTLYRPGITPDHPWADRRLVPMVLPATVIAASAAAAAAVRFARRRLPAGLFAGIGVVAVLVIVVPPALATAPLAARRTEVGEPSAVAAVCAALRPGDAVLSVADERGGVRAQNEWVQVVRGVCGYPSAALLGDAADRLAAVRRLADLVTGRGGRLVLLAAGEDDASASAALAGLGLRPRRAVLLHTREDQHLLLRRPDGLQSLVIDVWLAVWTPAVAG
jgi:hypothetical protein